MCFSLCIAAPRAQAYAGNEAMTSGDASVVEAIMLNLMDYAVRVAEEETDITLTVSDPDELFVDSVVEAALTAVPVYGPMLNKVYSYTKMTAEAAWELGEALAEANSARRDLLDVSLRLALTEQGGLVELAAAAYELGAADYAKGRCQPPQLGYDAEAQVAETLRILRDNASHIIFLLDSKSKNRINAAADALEDLAESLPSVTEMYQIGYEVAKAQDPQRYIRSRIDLLYSKLDGKYFTTTGATCGNDSCDRCNVVNVVESEHLKDLLDGFVPSASIMKKVAHNYGEGNPFTAGNSCCGFANFAAWYIFAEDTTDYMKFNCICPDGKPVEFTEVNLRAMGIKPGDVLRLSNHPTLGNSSQYKRHSVIFIDFTENGIMVLDSNYKLSGDSNNCVRKHELKYSAYKYTCVSRAENYDEKAGLEPESVVSTKTQYRYHTYVNENGARYICPYYGQDSEKYSGTTFTIRYTEWLDEPLSVDNGDFNYFSHPRHEKCAQYGCIDATYNGDRYRDANGLTWYYQETRQVENTAAVELEFSDVEAGAYYEDPVRWAVAKDITVGTSATAFSPQNLCTRAQIITFLWRAVGSPKATMSNPFTDVKAGDYYYDAAIWAYQKGMVSGTTFAGNTPCTRADTVVYLWKYAGSPTFQVTNIFVDVLVGSEYAQAVAWAVANGVTAGTSTTTFSPDNTCTRGQIVTFLYRCVGK